MDEVIINKVEWSAPEYKHEEKSADFLWTIGLGALVICGFAIWFHNYLFGVFILLAGGSLILFSVREPKDMTFSIETAGLSMGKDKYEWKKIKGFDIKKGKGEAVLLIEIDKYLLPVYTIPLPIDILPQIKESLLKVIPAIELEESKSIKFAEKIGF